MNTIQKISLKFIDHNKNKKLSLTEFNPAATADWIIKHSNLPWLKLNLQVPYETIKNEIDNIKQYFVSHRESDYSEHIGWNSFCIHGKSFDSTREDSFYNDTRPYMFTKEALELMPRTVDFFKTFENTNFFRIRVMELKPKGLISIHNDHPGPGMLHPVNIAITQPNSCQFVMENYGTVPFTPGDAYMLNVSNRHAIFNDSDESRYHIIMHYTPSEFIDNLIKTSYNTTYDNLRN